MNGASEALPTVSSGHISRLAVWVTTGRRTAARRPIHVHVIFGFSWLSGRGLGKSAGVMQGSLVNRQPFGTRSRSVTGSDRK